MHRRWNVNGFGRAMLRRGMLGLGMFWLSDGGRRTPAFRLPDRFSTNRLSMEALPQ
jgi:hypothetical protein